MKRIVDKLMVEGIVFHQRNFYLSCDEKNVYYEIYFRFTRCNKISQKLNTVYELEYHMATQIYFHIQHIARPFGRHYNHYVSPSDRPLPVSGNPHNS